MIDLKYPLVIEATEDPSSFGFYSPNLKDLLVWGILSRTVCIRLDGG